MKRIAILMLTAMIGLAASAAPIRYFTKSQATRTVNYLNAQNELMIYCGYDYEIETYVLLNEVWAERVNSSYYELWVYGYDAYTGEEIYMPLDLQCVWLYSAGRMYSAAQYLRFYTTARVPSLTWYVPSYNRYTRLTHRAGYVRTYHYDVHCHGWMPPTPPAGGYGPGVPPPMHPYYMRAPQTPAPRPQAVWTPGVDRPQAPTTATTSRGGNNGGSGTVGSTRPSAQPSSTTRSGNSTTTATTTRSTGTTTGTTGTSRSTSTGTTATGTSRSTSTGTTNTGSSRSTTTTRSTSTTPTGSTSRTGTSATSGSKSGTTTTTGTTRSGSTSTSGTTRSGSTSTSGTTRSGSKTTTSTTRSGSTSTSGTTRSGSTSTTSTTRSSGSTSRN